MRGQILHAYPPRLFIVQNKRYYDIRVLNLGMVSLATTFSYEISIITNSKLLKDHSKLLKGRKGKESEEEETLVFILKVFTDMRLQRTVEIY